MPTLISILKCLIGEPFSCSHRSCVGMRKKTDLNTTFCLGSIQTKDQNQAFYPISIQHSVQVQYLSNLPLTRLSLISIQHSVQVQYKQLDYMKNGASGFQYNILSRFNNTQREKKLIKINFNTTFCLGSIRAIISNPATLTAFQYNILSRFNWGSTKGKLLFQLISIQHSVQVQCSLMQSMQLGMVHFNTTFCLGSISFLCIVYLFCLHFNTTFCLGSILQLHTWLLLSIISIQHSVQVQL